MANKKNTGERKMKETRWSQVKKKSQGGNGNFKPTDYQSFTSSIKKGAHKPKAQMAGAYPRFLSMTHA